MAVMDFQRSWDCVTIHVSHFKAPTDVQTIKVGNLSTVGMNVAPERFMGLTCLLEYITIMVIVLVTFG